MSPKKLKTSGRSRVACHSMLSYTYCMRNVCLFILIITHHCAARHCNTPKRLPKVAAGAELAAVNSRTMREILVSGHVLLDGLRGDLPEVSLPLGHLRVEPVLVVEGCWRVLIGFVLSRGWEVAQKKGWLGWGSRTGGCAKGTARATNEAEIHGIHT